MKKFIYTILSVSILFAGLGAVAEKVGARFKSDEKALELLRAARTAIGGDASLAGIQSLRIKGSTINTMKLDGAERSEPGETEIAIQLPDKVSKMVRIGNPGADDAVQMVRNKVETVVVTGNDENGNLRVGRGDGQGTGIGSAQPQRVIVLTNNDEAPGEAKTEAGRTVILRTETGNGSSLGPVIGELREKAADVEARHKTMQQNELFRLTLGLLLSPPAGIDANYTFGGEASIDGTPCNIVVAQVGSSSVKLFLNKSTNLPMQMTYSGEAMPVLLTFKRADTQSSEPEQNLMFVRHADSSDATAEFTVRYSDYRSVNGIQLPFHWSTSGGDQREEFDVTSYEVNPADISSSFEQPKMEFNVNK